MKNAYARMILVSTGIGLFLSLLLVMPLGAAPQDLPPRPTSVPTPTAEALPLPPQGALIKLVAASPVDQEIWTVVQWQDAWGEWHEVDGWQGAFTNRVVLWYVGPENLNTGPFRWLVYQNQGGLLLDTSEVFDLPTHVGQIRTIEILSQS